MVEPRGILLDHEGTKIHGFLQEELNTILINVAMEGYFDAASFRVKVYNNPVVIIITNEEAICTSSYR